jgi:hypothetical protein
MKTDILIETKTHEVKFATDMSMVIRRKEVEYSIVNFSREELAEALYALIAHENTDSMSRTALRYMLAKAGFHDTA